MKSALIRLRAKLNVFNTNLNNKKFSKYVLSQKYSGLPSFSMVGGKSVLFVVNSIFPYDRSGYAYRSFHIMQAYKKLGFDVYVICKTGSFRESDNVVTGLGFHFSYFMNTKVAIFNSSKNTNDLNTTIEFGRAIINYSLNKNIDFIHASSNYIVGFSALYASRKITIPLIYEIRGMWHITRASKEERFYSSVIYKHQDAMERLLISKASGVLFITDKLRKKYECESLLNSAVLPNCIDLTNVIEKNTLQYKVGSSFRLLYIGSLVFYEGLELLIRVVSKLDDKGITLSIFGDGPDTEKIKALILSLESRNIKYFGRVDQPDVNMAYSKHHAVVVPRINCEVTTLVSPLKPLEAIWSGLPVITSDLPAIREVMGEVKSVVYVEPSSEYSLRSSILKLQYEYDSYLLNIQADKKYLIKERSWSNKLKEAVNELCS